MLSAPYRKNLGRRCFHFDDFGNPRSPPCTRGTYYCGYVHPDEPEWASAKSSGPPHHSRKSDQGWRFLDYDDYGDRPAPPPPRGAAKKDAATLLLTKIKEEQAAKEKEEASNNNPAASSSRTKIKSSKARESVSRPDTPTSTAAVGSSSSLPIKTSTGGAPMSALNPASGKQQQQGVTNAAPTAKSITKSTQQPTKRPTPIIPPPPNTAFANTFSSMSLGSPGFPPNTNTSQPQPKTTDDNAMHVDRPISSAGASGSGITNKAAPPSDTQQPQQLHSASPGWSATQPPPPPNPPPELPYPPPPPIPNVPDGLRLSNDRSRQPSVAMSEAGSENGRRPSLSISQDDPRYVKWMNVIRIFSRCIDIEAELQSIDKNVQDAQCFISIGGLERLDSSLNGLKDTSTSAATFGTSSFSAATPTSATAPGFTIPPTSAGSGSGFTIAPMDISEELTALIARRQVLLKEKAEREEELVHLDSWPSAPHAPSVDNMATDGDGAKVDYKALVDAVANFKDMVVTMMQLLSEHVSFFEKRKQMPVLPDELMDLRMEEGSDRGERGKQSGEGDMDWGTQLDRELEHELERVGGRQGTEEADVTAEVGNLSLENTDKDGDGDVAMHDGAEGSSAARRRSKKPSGAVEAARGVKRRRLNMEGDAEPSMEEMEQVLNSLQELENKITDLANNATQAEATWKDEYSGIVEEKVAPLMEGFKKKLHRYRKRTKELEKEKKQWEEREQQIAKEREREREEREQERARETGRFDGNEEAEWMGMLYNEVVPLQGPEGEERQTSFAKLWTEVNVVQGDVELVRKDISLTKTEVEQLTHELAMERVEFEKTKSQAQMLSERLEKAIKTQQELAASLSSVETYIRNTAEEITAHQASIPAPPPPPPLPSQRLILQSIEPQLLSAVREDIRPKLLKLRQDVEHTVQEGAKASFSKFAEKLGMTMNILEAIHRKLEENPTMLESLAQSIQPVRGSTSTS